jgi:hypothetical protein
LFTRYAGRIEQAGFPGAGFKVEEAERLCLRTEPDASQSGRVCVRLSKNRACSLKRSLPIDLWCHLGPIRLRRLRRVFPGVHRQGLSLATDEGCFERSGTKIKGQESFAHRLPSCPLLFYFLKPVLPPPTTCQLPFFHQHSRFQRVTTFVFCNIPASPRVGESRSFVFIDIRAWFLQFLKSLGSSFTVGGDILS